MNICLPCEKDNHRNCLAVDLGDCECDLAEHESCESCGRLLLPDDRWGCEHGKSLCVACSNECRYCEDEAARDEAIDRRISEMRGGGRDY